VRHPVHVIQEARHRERDCGKSHTRTRYHPHITNAAYRERGWGGRLLNDDIPLFGRMEHEVKYTSEMFAGPIPAPPLEKREETSQITPRVEPVARATDLAPTTHLALSTRRERARLETLRRTGRIKRLRACIT